MKGLIPLQWLASLQTCNQKAVHLGEAWSCHLKLGQLYTLVEQKFHLKTEWQQGLGSQLVLVSEDGLRPLFHVVRKETSLPLWKLSLFGPVGPSKDKVSPLHTREDTLCFTWSTDPETSRMMYLQIPGPPVVKSSGHKICHCIYCADTTC